MFTVHAYFLLFCIYMVNSLHSFQGNMYLVASNQTCNIQYIFTAAKNIHWAPYAGHIGLCGMNYDMIGQLETSEQHIKEIKREVFKQLRS